jgi:hypothetical protein
MKELLLLLTLSRRKSDQNEGDSTWHYLKLN